MLPVPTRLQFKNLDFPIPPSGSVSTEKIPGYRSIAESRLTKDFYVVQWLGKGGFGDVYLAR